MTAKVECPECGKSKWTDLKYLSNGFASFMVEGRCILCGFTIDADYLLDLVYQNVKDLYIITEPSPRFNHDKSLQEVTLRDYPLYAKVLKKALESSDEKDEETVKQISGMLGMVYNELAWYAKNMEDTWNNFSLSQYYSDIEEGKTSDEDETNCHFMLLARDKAGKDWWMDKRGLLEEAYEISKKVEGGSPSEWIEWGFQKGMVAYDYGIALGNAPEAKEVFFQAIDEFQHSLNWAHETGIGSSGSILDENWYITVAHQQIAKIHEIWGDKKAAYAHYVLAEQYAPNIEVFGEEATKRISAARKKMEDKLADESIAEAKEMARENLAILEQRSFERKATQDSLTSRDRIRSHLMKLKNKMPQCSYEKLERFSPDNPAESCLTIRKAIEWYERELYSIMFGSRPKGSIRRWSEPLLRKLQETDPRAGTMMRFTYGLASQGCHESEQEFLIEDFELLCGALVQLINWFQAFQKRLNGETL